MPIFKKGDIIKIQGNSVIYLILGIKRNRGRYTLYNVLVIFYKEYPELNGIVTDDWINEESNYFGVHYG